MLRLFMRDTYLKIRHIPTCFGAAHVALRHYAGLIPLLEACYGQGLNHFFL
jgi:hypothetical protein